MSQGSTAFLSTLPAEKGQRRLALAAVLLSGAIFVFAAPFAKQPLPPLPAFLPAYQSALVINDLITCVLLFGLYNIVRSRGLLLSGAIFVFAAPFAKQPLPPLPAFLPAYQSALVINDLITCVLLF